MPFLFQHTMHGIQQMFGFGIECPHIVAVHAKVNVVVAIELEQDGGEFVVQPIDVRRFQQQFFNFKELTVFVIRHLARQEINYPIGLFKQFVNNIVGGLLHII